MQINDIINVAKIVLIIGGTISITAFFLLSILFMPSFFQKMVNLKRAEHIMQENLEIVEKATFFQTNQDFNKIIDEQMDTIRKNAAKLKSLHAEIDQIGKDISNKKKGQQKS